MENNTLVWDNLVNAFLEDMKQFPIGDSLYAFVVAYNIATKEMEVEESNKEFCDYVDYVNAKTDLIWEEIGNNKDEYYRLRERVRQLEENRPQVQPPSKMYPNWTPHNPVPPWTVTCGTGTITTNNDQPTQYDPRDGKIHTSGYCQPENGPAVTGNISGKYYGNNR